MATEIERKFLIDQTAFFEESLPQPHYLKQAYLAIQDEKVVRARVYGEKGFLTIKGKTEGIERLEFEYEIPTNEAHEMIKKLGGPAIEKDRYLIKKGKHTWEVDIFYGDNEGLAIAEIELSHSDEAFEKPHWVLEEVSHDPKYFNSALQSHPFKNW